MDRVLRFIKNSFDWGVGTTHIMESIYSDFTSKDSFQHLLYVDISEDVFEVPVVIRNIALLAKHDGYSEVCMPIMNNNTPSVKSRRTVGPIMLDFLNNRPLSFQAIVTSKGERYYGCPGLILDQDYNPLLVLTYECYGGEVIKYRCRISNNVFVYQNKLIEKTISKKFIPVLTTEYASSEDKFDGVFIGNINLVVKPVVPTPNKDINEDINKFLIDNVEDLL